MGTDDKIYSVDEERDQQINDMAMILLIAVRDAGNQISYKNLATKLYDAGYRKLEDESKGGTDDET